MAKKVQKNGASDSLHIKKLKAFPVFVDSFGIPFLHVL